jgi:hypothetical protein
MRRHWLLMNRVTAWASEQERLANAEDLQQVAEDARNKILRYLEARRSGEPVPVLEPSTDQNSPARERLRQRLDETGRRLRRYAELRGQNGIR